MDAITKAEVGLGTAGVVAGGVGIAYAYKNRKAIGQKCKALFAKLNPFKNMGKGVKDLGNKISKDWNTGVKKLQGDMDKNVKNFDKLNKQNLSKMDKFGKEASANMQKQLVQGKAKVDKAINPLNLKPPTSQKAVENNVKKVQKEAAKMGVKVPSPKKVNKDVKKLFKLK